MDKFQKWLIDHKISSHTIAVFVTSLVTMYVTDEQFAATVNVVLKAHPKVFAIVSGLVTLYMRYSSAKRVLTAAEQRSADAADAAAGK